MYPPGTQDFSMVHPRSVSFFGEEFSLEPTAMAQLSRMHDAVTPSPSICHLGQVAPLPQDTLVPSSVGGRSTSSTRESMISEESTSLSSAPHTEQRRVAATLAQLLKAPGGLERLNALSPQERAILASKVQAFHRHVLAAIQKQVSTVSPLSGISASSGSTPSSTLLPSHHALGSSTTAVSSSAPPATACFTSSAASEHHVKQPSSLTAGELFNPTHQQPQCPPKSEDFATLSAALLKCLAKQNPSSLAASLETALRAVKPSAVTKPSPVQPPQQASRHPQLAQAIEYLKTILSAVRAASQEQQNKPPTPASEPSPSLKSDASDKRMFLRGSRFKRAAHRRSLAGKFPNSVEMRVWKCRRLSFSAGASAQHEESTQCDDKQQKHQLHHKPLSYGPIWDGSSYLFDTTDRVALPLSRVWWNALFRSDAEAEVAASDVLTAAALNPQQEYQQQPGVSSQCRPASLACGFIPAQSLMIAPLYPPSIHEDDVVEFPETPAEELAYAKDPAVPDRMLQEMLRAKWHLASDLMRPVPRCILEKSGGTSFSDSLDLPEDFGAAFQGAPARLRRPLVRLSTADSSRKSCRSAAFFPCDYADVSPHTALGTRRTKRVYKPSTANRLQGYYTACQLVDTKAIAGRALASPPSPGPQVLSAGESVASSTVGSPVPDSGSVDVTKSESGGRSPSQTIAGIESEFELIKRRSGWHPYVWYLMCRRPELYGIGIRARVVARVAGWEWDDIQKVPDLLRTFLQRIDAFVADNPVPRSADKKEAKEYKHFAANSVRTPWFQVETSAVRRALRDMEGATGSNFGGGESDSGVSDGCSSGPLSSGQLTPMCSESITSTTTYYGEQRQAGTGPATLKPISSTTTTSVQKAPAELCMQPYASYDTSATRETSS